MSTNLIELIKQRAQNHSTIHDMAEGLSPMPMVNPVIKVLEIEDAEKALGFKLPQLLIDILTQIGNGGFGPGYGIYKLSNAVKIYREKIDEPQMNWQKGLLPILTWGCTYEICIDCLADGNPVYFIEVIEDEDSCHCLDNVSFTLTDKDGNLIASGNTGDDENTKQVADSATCSIQVKSILQNSNFEKYMNDWANGVDLWSEIMGEYDDNNGWSS